MSKGGSGRNVPSMASIDGTSHERPPATRQPGAAGLRAALGILLLWLPATQALAEAGADPLFGTNGVAAVIEDGRPVAGWSAVPGGGFVAAGRPRFTARHTVDLRLYRLDREGHPLRSWGNDGIVDVSLGPFEQDAFDAASASVLGIADDGSLLLGAYLTVTPSASQRGRGYGLRIAAKLRADGRIDASFGKAGLLDAFEYGREERWPVLQPDGTTIAAVYDMLADVYPVLVRYERFGRDGLRDAGFRYAGPDDYEGVAISGLQQRADGRWWIVTDAALYRLLADGRRDPAFGDQGRVDLPQQLARRLSAAGGLRGVVLHSVTMRADGKLQVAFSAQPATPGPDSRLWGLSLIDTEGQVVDAYGDSGIRRFEVGDLALDTRRLTSQEGSLQLAPGPDGDLLVLLHNSLSPTAAGDAPRYTGLAVLRWDAQGRARETLAGDTPGWLSLGSAAWATIPPSSNPVLQFADGHLLRLAAPTATAPGVITAESRVTFQDEGTGEIAVPLMRAGGTRGAVSVHFSTGATLSPPLGFDTSEAEAGQDYEALSGRLEWADGESGIKLVRLRLLDDAQREGYETVSLVLDQPTGEAGVAQSRIVVVINPSDQPASAAIPTTTASTPPASAAVPVTPASGGGGMLGPAWLLLTALGARRSHRRARRRAEPEPLPGG